MPTGISIETQEQWIRSSERCDQDWDWETVAIGIYNLMIWIQSNHYQEHLAIRWYLNLCWWCYQIQRNPKMHHHVERWSLWQCGTIWVHQSESKSVRWGIFVINSSEISNAMQMVICQNILYMKRSGLKTISEWTNLKEKSLKSLQLHQNIGLELNLDGLMGGLDHLPLENLIVSREQLSAYFGLKRVSPNDLCFFRVQEWMKLSTLTYLRIYGSRRNDKIIFRDGSYGSQFHNVILKRCFWTDWMTSCNWLFWQPQFQSHIFL